MIEVEYFHDENQLTQLRVTGPYQAGFVGLDIIAKNSCSVSVNIQRDEAVRFANAILKAAGDSD